MNQTLRIIGGLFRGKKIQFTAVEDLRPTPDRVRETLFNWLMHDIHGATCLDAFAGSGALGFEACSRGAANVVLLEHHPKAYQTLKTNAEQFKTNNLSVFQHDCFEFLNQTPQVFDIIFLDPPFKAELIESMLTLLQQKSCLKSEGLLYIESNSQPTKKIDPLYWTVLKEKKAGLVYYALIQKR
jgi:16S rRNA (guanine966-N2)-methyltransferase